jgi:hypothetical protein
MLNYYYNYSLVKAKKKDLFLKLFLRFHFRKTICTINIKRELLLIKDSALDKKRLSSYGGIKEGNYNKKIIY